MIDIESIDAYQAMSDNELFEALALELLGETSLGMAAQRRNSMRQYGREAWHNAQRRLAEAICTDEGASRFTDSQVAIGQGLIAVICEALDFNETEGLIVGVLLLRSGLDNFCRRLSVPSDQPVASTTRSALSDRR